jgi:hypothetical protein
MPIEPIEEKDLDLEAKFKGKAEIPLEGNLSEAVKVEKEPASELTPTEKDSAYNKILAKVQQSSQMTVDPGAVASDAASVYQKSDSEGQIQNLVDLAMAKGVVHSVKVAQHLEDNYVLDMFHDKLLSDELHGALLKKGLIKEI